MLVDWSYNSIRLGLLPIKWTIYGKYISQFFLIPSSSILYEFVSTRGKSTIMMFWMFVGLAGIFMQTLADPIGFCARFITYDH